MAARAAMLTEPAISFVAQGRRLYVFKVFIEYPLNLGSDCILMFSVNLTFGETLG